MTRHPFTAVAGPSAFLGTPARRYYVGRCFCYWQDHVRAFGTIMWGRPLEEDIAEMIPFFELGTEARFAGHASFVDGRSLEAIDVLAFAKLLAYLSARQHAWGPNIGRQAILHPAGFVGVVVAGALKVARPPHPFECFEEGPAAFAWCGVADLHDEIEALRRAVSETPEIVRDVRAVFKERGPVGTVEAAKALGLSQRTLQRRLEEAGSSLRAERDHHLSLEIERLLGGTELDLDAIAATVGLCSASHLVTHFRGTHGITPGEWRAQRRAS